MTEPAGGEAAPAPPSEPAEPAEPAEPSAPSEGGDDAATTDSGSEPAGGPTTDEGDEHAASPTDGETATDAESPAPTPTDADTPREQTEQPASENGAVAEDRPEAAQPEDGADQPGSADGAITDQRKPEPRSAGGEGTVEPTPGTAVEQEVLDANPPPDPTPLHGIRDELREAAAGGETAHDAARRHSGELPGVWGDESGKAMGSRVDAAARESQDTARSAAAMADRTDAAATEFADARTRMQANARQAGETAELAATFLPPGHEADVAVEQAKAKAIDDNNAVSAGAQTRIRSGWDDMASPFSAAGDMVRDYFGKLGQDVTDATERAAQQLATSTATGTAEFLKGFNETNADDPAAPPPDPTVPGQTAAGSIVDGGANALGSTSSHPDGVHVGKALGIFSGLPAAIAGYHADREAGEDWDQALVSNGVGFLGGIAGSALGAAAGGVVAGPIGGAVSGAVSGGVASVATSAAVDSLFETGLDNGWSDVGRLAGNVTKDLRDTGTALGLDQLGDVTRPLLTGPVVFPPR